jgi:raffinose/stachyose/melibiose transport system permease protein
MGLYRYTWRTIIRELFLLFIAAAFCIPLYIVVVLSLKSPAGLYTHPLALPTDPQFSNYSAAMSGSSTVTLPRALINNVIITLSTVVLTITFGGLCAYTLARRKSKLSTGVYMLFVLGLIIPFQLGVIPLYAFLRNLGLVGTYPGIVILYVGLFLPFTVFLYTGFIRALPAEYEEAARVDGAGLFRVVFRIVLPLLAPITGTIAILVGVFTWNEFFLSVIFLSGTQNQSISVAIYGFVGQYESQWTLIFAAVVICIAPIVAFYLVAQKQLIKGFSGGIRG